MSKFVIVQGETVKEVIPNFIEPYTIDGIKKWYGVEFASQCIEAPDEVKQNWYYINGSFSADKVIIITDEEKKIAYENLTVQYIREQYSVDDEAKIIRECLANIENSQVNFTSYNTYVESCKTKAHTEVYGV